MDTHKEQLCDQQNPSCNNMLEQYCNLVVDYKQKCSFQSKNRQPQLYCKLALEQVQKTRGIGIKTCMDFEHKCEDYYDVPISTFHPMSTGCF